jgi:3-hydroxybutyryl-CoA dehydrogenase
VNRYMREGRDGLRTGQGFYDWKAVDVPTYRREALGRQLAMLRQLGILKPPGAAQGD